MNKIIDLEYDKNWIGTIVVTCQKCNKKYRRKLKDISPKTKIECTCGSTFTFEGDDLRKIQKELDDLKKSIADVQSSINNLFK